MILKVGFVFKEKKETILEEGRGKREKGKGKTIFFLK